MRRDFYHLSPDMAGSEQQSTDAANGGNLATSALRVLRGHPAARPAAMLDPTAEATPPQQTSSAPTTSVTTPSRPTSPSEQPSLLMAELDRAKTALAWAGRIIQTAEQSMTTIRHKSEPTAALNQLRPHGATITKAKADLVRTTETLQSLRASADRAAPAVQALIPEAVAEAGNLLRRADSLHQTHSRMLAETQQAAADLTAERALRQANGPVHEAEAVAQRIVTAATSVDKFLTDNQSGAATSRALEELTSTLGAAAGPVAGGTAAAKSAVEASKSASQQLRSTGQGLLERATRARVTIDRARERLPDLQIKLVRLQNNEAALSTMESAFAAHTATGSAEQALAAARQTHEDVARLLAAGEAVLALHRAQDTKNALATTTDRLRITAEAIQDVQRQLAAAPTPDDPVRHAALALLSTTQESNRRHTEELDKLTTSTRAQVEQATAKRNGPEPTEAPQGQASSTPTVSTRPSHAAASRTPVSPAVSGRGSVAARAALTQLGVSYRWGGTSPGKGFDCSGLTQWAYRQAGVHIPRTSGAQATGTRLAREQLRPGDLIVWQGHVAMFIGEGRMVEAGDPVQVRKLRTTNLNMKFLGFYRPSG